MTGFTAEKHDSYSFGIVADAKGADGGNGHEEIFIERLAFENVFPRFPQDAVAQEEVGHDIGRERKCFRDEIRQVCNQEEKCTDDEGP